MESGILSIPIFLLLDPKGIKREKKGGEKEGGRQPLQLLGIQRKGKRRGKRRSEKCLFNSFYLYNTVVRGGGREKALSQSNPTKEKEKEGTTRQGLLTRFPSE